MILREDCQPINYITKYINDNYENTIQLDVEENEYDLSETWFNIHNIIYQTFSIKILEFTYSFFLNTWGNL